MSVKIVLRRSSLLSAAIDTMLVSFHPMLVVKAAPPPGTNAQTPAAKQKQVRNPQNMPRNANENPTALFVNASAPIILQTTKASYQPDLS